MNGMERIAGEMEEFFILSFFLEKNAEAGMRGTNPATGGNSQLLRMLMLTHKWILYAILQRAPVSPTNILLYCIPTVPTPKQKYMGQEESAYEQFRRVTIYCNSVSSPLVQLALLHPQKCKTGVIVTFCRHL